MTPTPASPLAILERSLVAVGEAGNYHVKMDMKVVVVAEFFSMTIPMEMEGDIKNNRDFQGIFSASVMGESFKTDMVIFDGETYLREESTDYWELSTDSSVTDDPTAFSSVDISLLKSPKHLGIVPIEAIASHHIRASMDAGDLSDGNDAFSNVDGEFVVEYWIGVDDYYPRKVTFTGDFRGRGDEVMGADFGPDVVTLEMEITMQSSNFGSHVVITNPETSGPLAPVAVPTVRPAPVAVPTVGPVPAPPSRRYDVNASEFLNEFEENAVAAAGKYEGEVITVRGKVQTIDFDLMGDAYVSVTGGGMFEFNSIWCMLSDASQSAGLNSGDDVAVTGRFEDWTVMIATLSDCLVK